MAVPMPAVVILFVCKVAIAGPPDANADWTHSENLDWATPNAMMLCRRHEVQLYDPSVDQGADPQPFTPMACQRAGAMMGPNWNEQHKSSKYRFWRYACPVAIINEITGEVIGWKLPDCGRRDTVVCEQDTAI